MELHGRSWTRRQLEERMGRTDGLFGLRRYKGVEGVEAEVEWIRLQSGAGLEIEVCPSKALDLGRASYCGMPLHWSCVNGDVHPSYYEPHEAGWLRTASGGLLMTCGLANVGGHGVDRGDAHGMHGRIHHLPARQVVAEGRWERKQNRNQQQEQQGQQGQGGQGGQGGQQGQRQDEDQQEQQEQQVQQNEDQQQNQQDQQEHYTMRVAGVMEETAIYGRHLRLERELAMIAGENRITLTDTVTNFGFQPAEHMMLYHFNFGFPLLGEQTSLVFPHTAQVARIGGGETAGYRAWPLPHAADAEAVYEHRMDRLAIGADGMAEARIVNPAFPAGGTRGAELPVEVRLRWSVDTLPCLTQWTAPLAGEHVLSIEPGNCGVMGRAAAREQGQLRVLAPGETVHYRIEMQIVT